MKLLLLLFLLPSLFFKPDAIEGVQHVKHNHNGIFKIKPKDPGGMKILNTDKQVYNWIASSTDSDSQ